MLFAIFIHYSCSMYSCTHFSTIPLLVYLYARVLSVHSPALSLPLLSPSPSRLPHCFRPVEVSLLIFPEFSSALIFFFCNFYSFSKFCEHIPFTKLEVHYVFFHVYIPSSTSTPFARNLSVVITEPFPLGVPTFFYCWVFFFFAFFLMFDHAVLCEILLWIPSVVHV